MNYIIFKNKTTRACRRLVLGSVSTNSTTCSFRSIPYCHIWFFCDFSYLSLKVLFYLCTPYTFKSNITILSFSFMSCDMYLRQHLYLHIANKTETVFYVVFCKNNKNKWPLKHFCLCRSYCNKTHTMSNSHDVALE